MIRTRFFTWAIDQMGDPRRWRETLDEQVAASIADRHRDWLQSHGYLP